MQFEKVKRIMRQPLFITVVVLVAFLIAFVPVFTEPKVNEMGPGTFFILQVIPIPYWIGISVIVCAISFMIMNLKEERAIVFLVFSSILLLVCFRMVFPVIFTSVPAYEPDAVNYMTVVNSWVTHGIDFGFSGNYQYDYPLSFLVAFIFIKLGVSIDTFYRVAPFCIYALDAIFLYLLVKEVVPENRRNIIPALSVFLFSFSSLGYWVTVHYCPDLFGSLMFFLCLYLGVRFAKAGKWSIPSLLPVLLSLFALILSHHLSTLYLIVTFFGLSLSMWFFKPAKFKRGAITFFILAIFTYTLWFAYGSLVYPSFFSVYIYFSGFTSATQQVSGAGLFNNLAFAIYPLFIIVLFLIQFSKKLQIQNPLLIVKKPLSLFRIVREKLHELQVRESENIPLVFSMGFSFVYILFIIGLGLPVLFGSRILEVLCIGLYPLASQTLLKAMDDDSSKKKKILIFVLLLLVVITGVYRYYSQIQRRLIGT